MIGFIVQESIELSWISIKIAYTCLKKIYCFVFPSPDLRLELIELKKEVGMLKKAH